MNFHFFFRRWQRRCRAKTRSLAGGVREHTNKIGIIILHALGRCWCWRRGGVRGLRDEREPTDGRLKEKDAQCMTRRTAPPTRVLVLPRSNLLSIAHYICAIAAEACKAFYSHLHAHQPCSANRPALKHNSILCTILPTPATQALGSSPVFRSLLLCFRSTSVTPSSLTRAILSMRLSVAKRYLFLVTCAIFPWFL